MAPDASSFSHKLVLNETLAIGAAQTAQSLDCRRDRVKTFIVIPTQPMTAQVTINCVTAREKKDEADADSWANYSTLTSACPAGAATILSFSDAIPFCSIVITNTSGAEGSVKVWYGGR